jgi:hypothetical protein
MSNQTSPFLWFDGYTGRVYLSDILMPPEVKARAKALYENAPPAACAECGSGYSHLSICPKWVPDKRCA